VSWEASVTTSRVNAPLDNRRIRRELSSSGGIDRIFRGLAAAVSICLLLTVSLPAKAQAEEIASKTAVVDGLKLHYLIAGHGPAVILLHGYTQTSRMWRPIIPVLAGKFTIIAPETCLVSGIRIFLGTGWI
jgi:hypothetical protein